MIFITLQNQHPRKSVCELKIINQTSLLSQSTKNVRIIKFVYPPPPPGLDDFFRNIGCRQGTGIKGKEMALVRQEKASRTALQTSTVNLQTLFCYRHTLMTTVKEIVEQCRRL